MVRVQSSGIPYPSARLYFYETGTTTLKPVYTDEARTIAFTQPVQADAAGQFAPIFIDPTAVYKTTLNTLADVLIETLDPAYDGALNQAQLGLIFNPRTAAEIAAGVTPTALQYPPGDVRRFSPALDGTTDDTTALQNWVAVPGYHEFPVVATAKITAAIPLVSNSTFVFAKGSVVQTAATGFSLFSATSKSNILISGAKFKQTTIGGGGYIGGVALISSTDCKVEDCEFDGMEWAGVFISSSNRCAVRRAYCHDFLGTAQDTPDVCIYEDSHYNIVEGCFLNGGKGIGVLIQNPPANTLIPTHNSVDKNYVGAHTEDGIVVYMPHAADSYNSITNNHVQDISGSYDTNLYGTGIYVVGVGAGGTLVHGNRVKNCCTAVVGTTNAQAGITVSALNTADQAPVIVTNNIVVGMTKCPAIWAAANSSGQVIIADNAINHPSANTTHDAIDVEDTNNVIVSGNNIKLGTTRRGIAVYANVQNVSNVIVKGNMINGGGSRQIEFLVAGGHTFTDVEIEGNVMRGGANGVVAMYLDSIAGLTHANNRIAGSNTYALYANACTSARYSNNVLSTSGTVGVGFGGTSTNSYFDKTNLPGGFIENQGTGLICEQFGSAAPASASSYARVGDRVEQSVPVVGNPKGWRATVAGNPGTWQSEGNL